MWAAIGRMFSTDEDPEQTGKPNNVQGGPTLPPLKGKATDGFPEQSPATTAGLEASPATTTWTSSTTPGHQMASPVTLDHIRDGADSPSAQPSPQGQPMMWPRTASGDNLEQILGLMGKSRTACLNLPLNRQPSETRDGQPQQPREESSLSASPPAASVQAPKFWPRTLSGDDLDFAIQQHMVAAASPPAQELRLPIESVTKPTFWPATFDGDDLDALAAAAMADVSPMRQASPITSCGEKTSTSRGGSMDMSSPASRVCLATSPAVHLRFDAKTPVASSTLASRAQGASPAASAGSCLDVLLPPPPPSDLPPVIDEACLPPPPDSSASAPKDAKVVSILDSLTEPAVGTPERPTKGSWGHSIGKCKPCAFLHTKGCKNGTECEFCHICGRGEKKRRQRDKWQSIRHHEAVVAHSTEMQQAMCGQMYYMPPPLPPLPTYGYPLPGPAPLSTMPWK